MNRLRQLKAWLEERNFWQVIAYTFFGQLATLVNLAVHFICMHFFAFHYMAATMISWFFANSFSFATNKRWVFRSKTPNLIAFSLELLRFLFYRLLALGVDMACMYLLMEWVHAGNVLAKIITQLIVGVANYFFSKFLIFRNLPKK